MFNPDRTPKRALLITCFAGAFFVGLLAGRAYLSAPLAMIIAVAITAGLALKSRLALPAIVVFGLVIGIARGYQHLDMYRWHELMLGQKLTLTGIIEDDPVRNDKGHMQFVLGNLRHEEHKIPGSLRVRSHYAHMQRGYQVEIEGKIAESIGSIPYQVGFAGVRVVSMRQSWLEELRQRFMAGMRTALPEPLSSLALGLLIGTRALIPKAWQTKLAATGLSHIVAVSGYNLTILVRAARKPLARYSKFLALAIPLWLIAGFLAMTGLSASIVRASIVSILALLGLHYGRRIPPMTLLSVAAVSTALVDPDYFYRDLGWQLSFLAFFGVLVVAPAFQQRFVKRPNAIKGMFLESLAAQALTFPLIMLIFNQVSLISPLANLLVLPLIPMVMLLAFLAALSGMLVPVLSGWIALPANWLLKYIFSLIDWTSSIPTASVPMSAGLGAVLGIYALIIVALVLSIRGSKAAKRYQTAGT